jgi:hypothetical protein
MPAEMASHESLPQPGYRVPTTAIATMGLIYGFASMLCLPYSFLPMVDNGWAIAGFRTPPETLWVLCATCVELGLGFLLIISCMGCFSFSAWARNLLLTWGWITLGWGFIGLAFYVRWLFPESRGDIAIVRGEGPWGGMVFWAIDWVFAACVLHHLIRPWVKERVESGEPASEL